MKRTLACRAFARAGVLVAALALAPSAFAHAELFPNVIPSGDGYLLNLAVPNEKAERVHDRDPAHDPERVRSRGRRASPGLDGDRKRSPRGERRAGGR